MWKRLLVVSAVSAAMSSMALAAPLTVGFSQVGSESGWRAAETNVAKSEAEKRGITLKIADGQQKQENQIKAVRSFVAQGVDAIFIAPVVATGWEPVLKEAKDAEIPVFLLDRSIDVKDKSLYIPRSSPKAPRGSQYRRASPHPEQKFCLRCGYC